MHRERGRSGKPGTPSFRRGCHHETRPKSLCARLDAQAFHRVDAETPCRDVRAERAQTGGRGCARECPPMPRGGRCQGGGKAGAEEGAAGEHSGKSCVSPELAGLRAVVVLSFCCPGRTFELHPLLSRCRTPELTFRRLRRARRLCSSWILAAGQV